MTSRGQVNIEDLKPGDMKVNDFHTYFVGGEDWGFSVWAHNTSCDARILRKNLDPTGTIAGVGDQAAHIVPTGAFSRRIAAVREGTSMPRKGDRHGTGTFIHIALGSIP